MNCWRQLRGIDSTRCGSFYLAQFPQEKKKATEEITQIIVKVFSKQSPCQKVDFELWSLKLTWTCRYNRAASNDYLYYWFIFWFLSWSIIWSIKCPKIETNAHLVFSGVFKRLVLSNSSQPKDIQFNIIDDEENWQIFILEMLEPVIFWHFTLKNEQLFEIIQIVAD